MGKRWYLKGQPCVGLGERERFSARRRPLYFCVSGDNTWGPCVGSLARAAPLYVLTNDHHEGMAIYRLAINWLLAMREQSAGYSLNLDHNGRCCHRRGRHCLEKSQGPARFSKGVYHANHLTQGFCSYRSGLRDVFSRVQRHRAVGYRRWISQDTVSETSLTCSKICLRCRCDAEGADMRAPRAAQLYMDIAVEHTRKPRLPSSF